MLRRTQSIPTRKSWLASLFTKKAKMRKRPRKKKMRKRRRLILARRCVKQCSGRLRRQFCSVYIVRETKFCATARWCMNRVNALAAVSDPSWARATLASCARTSTYVRSVRKTLRKSARSTSTHCFRYSPLPTH